MIKLICGMSRAGKTTYSKQFEDVIHLDYCGGIITCYDRASEKVSNANGDVIIEGVYNTVERRKALLSAFNGEGKRVCVWLNTELETIASRTFDHIPKPTYFEPPTLDEGWDEIIIIRGNDEQRINRQTED